MALTYWMSKGADPSGRRDARKAQSSPDDHRARLTLGADKGYDIRAFVANLRQMCVTPRLGLSCPVGAGHGVRPYCSGLASLSRTCSAVIVSSM